MIVKNGVKIFVKNPKIGKYLFSLRDNKSTILNPDTWSLFGGGIDDGESPLDAIKREVKEETNITIYAIRELGNMTVTQISKKNGGKEDIKNNVSFFLAKTDATLDEAELYEGQRLEYFTIEEVKELDNLALPIREAINEYEKLLN
jgi:8-oxo-dGTP pyrophosphatase MutT (NUDIX family)